MKILEKLSSLLVKKSTSKSKDVQAYCAIGLTKNDTIVINLDAKTKEDIIKIVFVSLSEIFSDAVIETVVKKYENDPETLDEIFNSVGNLLEKYQPDKEEEPEENDETPIVDPCQVFNNRKGIEDCDEFEE